MTMEGALKFTVLLVLVCCLVSEDQHSARARILSKSEVGAASNSAPLILTPLIKNGEIEKAKELSKVGPLDGTNITSYSGFLTVNETYNSNMFFWFFPSENEDATVLLWLQGGPGVSSLFALFTENGPFSVNENLVLETREFAWTNDYSVLYIDNPIGTGFSFTLDEAGYSTDQSQVADNLYETLQQFFTLFQELRDNPFYVTGESYAGKYVPAIGYKIHTENPTAKDKINFAGVAIGDGLIDPISQNEYGEFLYNVGLIDEMTLAAFQETEALQREYIRAGDNMAAFAAFDTIVNGDITPYPTLYNNATGLTNYFNYAKTENDVFVYAPFLNQSKVRDSIHVGDLPYNDGVSIVEVKLLGDFMVSVKPWVTALMENNYKVMLYSGQLDVIVATPLTYNFVNSIEWSGAEAYRTAERKIWKVEPTDDEVAGYAKQAGNFTLVVVRDAGHMIPHDQPRAALDMINRFTNDLPWN